MSSSFSGVVLAWENTTGRQNILIGQIPNAEYAVIPAPVSFEGPGG
jgi:hypothetical protein